MTCDTLAHVGGTSCKAQRSRHNAERTCRVYCFCRSDAEFYYRSDASSRRSCTCDSQCNGHHDLVCGDEVYGTFGYFHCTLRYCNYHCEDAATFHLWAGVLVGAGGTGDPYHPAWIYPVHWVVVDVDVRLLRLLHLGVNAQELARLRVVVAPDYVLAYRPPTRTAAATAPAPTDEVTVRRDGLATPTALSHKPLRPSCLLRRAWACLNGSRSTPQSWVQDRLEFDDGVGRYHDPSVSVDATAATTPFAKTGSKVHSRLPGFMLEVAPGSEDLPILLAMTELPLADARNRLSELVADVEQTQERVMITKHGHPAAVLISPDDLASLEETLDVLSDPDALADIRDAEAEASRGEYTSAEQMHLLLEERRRRDSGAA